MLNEKLKNSFVNSSQAQPISLDYDSQTSEFSWTGNQSLDGPIIISFR